MVEVDVQQSLPIENMMVPMGGEGMDFNFSEMLQDLFNNGLLARVTYDTLILAPQFICEQKHIDEMCDKARAAIRRSMNRPQLRAVS